MLDFMEVNSHEIVQTLALRRNFLREGVISAEVFHCRADGEGSVDLPHLRIGSKELRMLDDILEPHFRLNMSLKIVMAQSLLEPFPMRHGVPAIGRRSLFPCDLEQVHEVHI